MTDRAAAAMPAVVACADLAGHAGAREFEIGYTSDTPPHRWYAHARYQGAQVISAGHDHPEAAADGLAVKLLDGARCTHCGGRVTLPGRAPAAFGGNRRMVDGTTWGTEQVAAAGPCRWWRDGDRWLRGCAITHP